MFADKRGTTNISGGGAIIKSGYDPTVIEGRSQRKEMFKTALNFSHADGNEKTINDYAQLSTNIQAKNVLLKRASKYKLNAARELNNTNNIFWQHTQQAASLELSRQQSEGNNIRKLSQTLLDLGTEEHLHTGFTSHLAIADNALKDM